MKHTIAALLCALVLLAAGQSALAQGATYVFPYEGFRYTQADGETVLTQTNLEQSESLIASLGTTVDAVRASYIASGIVMEVLPDAGGQIAVSVADAGAFSSVRSISRMAEDQLAAFAAQFADSGLYETCELTETDPVCVRLTSSAMVASMPVYTLRYATLHLGRLYLLTETIVGRTPDETDDALIEHVLSGMELLSSAAEPTPTPTAIPAPTPTPSPAPTPGIAETLSATGDLTVEGIPAFTNSAQLTLNGQAEPNAAVSVTVGDRSIGRATADENGAFAVDVTLPATGDLTLTVSTEESERSFAVHYELPYATLTIIEPVETTFTGTNIFVRGVTEPEATVYVTGKGMNTNVQANRNGNFSVRVFIYDAETLTFTLRTRARGFQESTTEITLTRELTEREGIALFREQMVSLTYDDLTRDVSRYAGRKFILRGKIVEFADYDGVPCALVLTNNVSSGVWRDPIWVVLSNGETFDTGDIITFYLEGEGTTLPAGGEYTANGQSVEAPVTRAVYTSTNR